MAEQITTLASLTVNGKGSYGIGASAVPFSRDLYTYLRITDIKDDGTLNLQDLKSVDDDKASEYLLKPNDIVFARTGASTGRNYFYDGTDGEFVYAGFLIKFSIDEKKVNPKYIKYFCQSKQYKDWINSFNTGSTRGNINAQTLGKMPIPLIERKKQDALVSILSSIDEKIKKNEAINNNLEQQAQTLFENTFCKPADFATKRISLSNLMDYAGGSQPPASEFIFSPQEGYIRFVQIRDYDTDSHITYIPVSSKNKLCEEHDIMIARYGASLGRICFGINGAYNVALAKVFPKKTFYREFLRCYLSSRTFYEGINNKGGRSAQSGFNQSDINSFEIEFPLDEAIVKNFEDIIAPMFEQRLQLKKENQYLSSLRDTLLPKLMSGEIDVSNIEL
ncbi:restriction endonuclease subunit S [Massilimicrobiota sp. An134]|uniref:restriction endonuclease subunit S n=1 Tax=Massilimicrobiota sp. An134 TaxID=1965557 RepID=UPI001F14AF75|nr:restriction endonuclease subunit S [Massilimicrobiota sp. An134]